MRCVTRCKKVFEVMLRHQKFFKDNLVLMLSRCHLTIRGGVKQKGLETFDDFLERILELE